MRTRHVWAWRPAFGQLFLALLALLTVSELVLGLAIYGRLRSDLEADLGRRLVHVSQLLATGVDPALVLQFRRGDEDLPAYALTRARLARQVEAAGIENAYVVDRSLMTVLDSRREATLGETRYGLMVNRGEAHSALDGRASPTRLYRHEDGRLRLSALAPLRARDGAVVALVGVDATPEFFSSLAALRRRMILLGGLTLALSAIGTLLFLRQTERRLARLRQAMSRATRGDFTTRAQALGQDEIGALGRDLDELIASIVATRDYYETVLGSLEIALLTTDAAGEIRGVNASAQRLFASAEASLIGRPLAEVLGAEEVLSRFVAAARADDAHAASAEVPLRGGLAGGGLVVAASASRLPRGEEAPGLILSLLDVTELRALERRARANERLAALGGMAGGLLHELRNPLASMMLYLGLLKPLERSGEGGEILERALAEGERLAAFLEDFQAFAALRPLRLEVTDVGPVVESAAGALEWPTTVSWRWGERADVRVWGDRRLLEHAVRNVLQNAIEALRPKGGHVTVCTRRIGDEVAVVVADDGPGIPAELLERVLDPMFTTKAQGIGMGLSIVQRVVEAHGGTLRVASEHGHGAAFELRLAALEGK
jgi:nitrogen-specific signal transduction histidine kinase